jgi:bifunctional NMN adenylyltransferase/nudix hydrolase
MEELRVGVVIGRFQPLLNEQVEHIFKPAIEESDLTVVLLGSSMRARTAKDPLHAGLRAHMIAEVIDDTFGAGTSEKVAMRPIKDYLYSDTRWMIQVQSAVGSAVSSFIRENGLPLDTESKITLYGLGEKKYLKDFPQWDAKIAFHPKEAESWTERIKRVVTLPGLEISPEKRLYSIYEGGEDAKTFRHGIPGIVLAEIDEWLKTEEGQRIVEEYFYIKEYKARTQTGPYSIIFQTVDNVVIYKGNILLVRRRSKPGKGLWALPGGFLEANESMRNGAVRELKEETRLKVKPEWYVWQRTFDAPERSLRGRTITQAFLWRIPDWRDVPQVRAGSDAAKAQWFPISTVMNEMSDQLFEDHFDIIESMVRRLE